MLSLRQWRMRREIDTRLPGYKFDGIKSGEFSNPIRENVKFLYILDVGWTEVSANALTVSHRSNVPVSA